MTSKAAKAGKKVLATDTAQEVIGAVVDRLGEVAADKADDVAETVKEKAAKAGGRRKPVGSQSTAGTPPGKKSTAKKSSAKRPSARKTSTTRSTTARKR